MKEQAARDFMAGCQEDRAHSEVVKTDLVATRPELGYGGVIIVTRCVAAAIKCAL